MDHENRTRFTIAPEIGHLILHQKIFTELAIQTEVAGISSLFVCRACFGSNKAINEQGLFPIIGKASYSN